MKKLLVLMVFASSMVYGQNGVVIKDTLTLNNGSKFVKGDKVKVGNPSSGLSSFTFISTAPSTSIVGTIAPINISASWSNRTLVITGFKLHGNDAVGKRYYLLLSSGYKGGKYWCDPENAVAKGELIVE